jgi:hypothetical protein
MKPMKPMKPLESIHKGSEEANTWWPSELGQPSVSGSSDGLRYAYFSAKHRLAVDDGRKIRLYDKGSENISGFLTSTGRDLAFQTADGAKKVSSLNADRFSSLRSVPIVDELVNLPVLSVVNELRLVRLIDDHGLP